MAGKARRAANAAEQSAENVRSLMNRRDFLKRATGAAAAAALPSVPAAAAVSQAIGFDPSDPSRIAGMLLPRALEKGLRLPGGGEIVAYRGDAHLWGLEDYYGISKEQMQQIKAAMEAAKQALPSAPKEGISYFNTLTGQWHQRAAIPREFDEANMPTYVEMPYLKAGQSVPPEFSELNTESWLPEDIASFRYSDGSLTKPGLPVQRIFSANAPPDSAILSYAGPDQTGLPGPARTQIENFERDWRDAQREALEYYRQQSKDPSQSQKGKARYQKQLETLGLAPGGRYSTPPALQDTGSPTGIMGLLDDPSAPADEPQPNKLWQGRYPKGMYRIAAGSALAGLLAPIVMQENEDGR